MQPVAASVPEVEGGKDVTEHAHHRHGEAHVEPEEGNQSEGQPGPHLKQLELVRTELQVGAGEVTRQLVRGLTSDPNRRAGRFESAAELLRTTGVRYIVASQKGEPPVSVPADYLQPTTSGSPLLRPVPGASNAEADVYEVLVR